MLWVILKCQMEQGSFAGDCRLRLRANVLRRHGEGERVIGGRGIRKSTQHERRSDQEMTMAHEVLSAASKLKAGT